jgi:hypothetical protein
MQYPDNPICAPSLHFGKLKTRKLSRLKETHPNLQMSLFIALKDL